GTLSQREIGGALYIYISLNTVKSHARSIYRKLNVETRDDAVERARSLGLLSPVPGPGAHADHQPGRATREAGRAPDDSASLSSVVTHLPLLSAAAASTL